jgi:hypothetical protein
MTNARRATQTSKGPTENFLGFQSLCAAFIPGVLLCSFASRVYEVFSFGFRVYEVFSFGFRVYEVFIRL